MSKFNPSEPLTVGIEWDPRRNITEVVDYGVELGMRFTPTTTTTVTGASFYSPGPEVGGGDSWFVAWNLFTIYEDGQEDNYGDVRTASTNPNIASNSGGVLGGGAANTLDAIQSPNDNKYITLDFGDTLTVNFAAPAFEISPRRIVDVTFSIIVDFPIGADANATLNLGYMPVGLNFAQIVARTEKTYHISTGETYRAAASNNNRIWLSSDIDDLASGALDLQIQVGDGEVEIRWVGMTVTYCDENRVAAGCRITGFNGLSDPLFTPGWQTAAPMLNVLTGATGRSLTAGQDYIVTLTRARDIEGDGLSKVEASTINYQFGVPRQLAAIVPGDEDITPCVDFTRLSNGLIAVGSATHTGTTDITHPRGRAIVLHASNGQPLLDASDPYAKFVPTSQSTYTQQLSAIQGATFRAADFTTRYFGSPAPLDIRVGGFSVGTLSTDQHDEFETDEAGWARVRVDLDSPVVALTATPFTVSFVSPTGSSRWEIPSLSTLSSTTPYPQATYGGSTLTGQSDTKLDYPVTLSSSQPPVTGAAIAHEFAELTAAVGEGCTAPMLRSIDTANFSWGQVPVITGSPLVTGAPLVTGFSHYEIQRRDSIDSTWMNIGRIDDRTVTAFIDYEGRIGVSTDYRVRQCRMDGVCGDYATVTGFVRQGASTATEAPLTTGGCDGLIFTSNQDPTATVAYPYNFGPGTAPLEDFQFYESETVVFQRLHGRDYMVGLKPTELGGTRFTRTLLVNAITVPPKRLDRGFTNLRDLAWSTLAYVCVLDHRGGRWFSTVIVPSVSVREVHQVYTATVDVIETTGTPTVVTQTGDLAEGMEFPAGSGLMTETTTGEWTEDPPGSGLMDWSGDDE